MGAGQFLLQAIAMFLAIYLLNRYFSKTTPHNLSENSGLIKPSKVLSYFCVIFCSIVFAGGLWLIFSNDDRLIGFVCAAMGLFGAIVMLPSISNFHDVNWDQNGITGPTGKSFPKLPTQQINIAWDDIIKMDEAWSNYQFVEDKNGSRIYWGYWYRGEQQLREKIQRHLNQNAP